MDIHQLDRRDFIALLAIVIITIAVTVPFFSKYLLTHDAANFALGMHNYSIELHQPHPPGYLLFIFFGKIIRLFIQDDNISLIIVSNIFALLSLGMLYLLLSVLFGRKVAVVGSLIYVFNPAFWFFREVALTYTVDSFAATAAMYTAVLVRITKKPHPFYLQMILLAVAAGFRPTIALLQGGIVILTIIYISIHERNIHSDTYLRNIVKHVSRGIFIFIFISFVWFIPMVVVSGGITQYLHAAEQSRSGTVIRSSIIYGAPLSAAWNFITFFIMVFTAALLPLLPLLLGGVVVLCSPLLYRNAVDGTQRYFHRGEFIVLIMCSMLPSVLLYTLVHFGQPGYILILLPASIVIASLGIASLINKKWGIALIVFTLTTEIFLYTIPGTRTFHFRARLYTLQTNNQLDQFLNHINPFLLYFNLNSLHEDNMRCSLLIKEIRRIVQEYGSRELILIIDPFHPFHEKGEVKMNDPWVPHLKYYFPEVETIVIAGDEGRKGGGVIKNYQMTSECSTNGSQLFFNRMVRTAVIVTQQLDDTDIPRGIQFVKNRFTYVFDVSTTNRFNFLGVSFIRK